jgi:CcmD family protein
MRLLALAFAVLSLAAAVAGQTTPAQEGFVPIDQLPAPESFPAAPLVIAAYAFAWLAVFVYVWSVWARLGRVERELKGLEVRAGRGGRP